MRAAKNFTLGIKGESGETGRVQIRSGEDIPDDLLDQVPDELILEKVARSDPQSLTREQLMELAGLTQSDDSSNGSEDEEEEFNEEEFREGLSEFTTKRELVDWAQEAFGLELDQSDKREDLEDQIVSFVSGEEEE